MKRLNYYCAKNRGVTLIELMVSLALMLVVTLASVGLFTVNNQSYRTVDGNQLLQDNARFAFEVIGQAVRVAGYQERAIQGPGNNLTDLLFGLGKAWPVYAANNANMSATSDSDFGTNGTGGSPNLSDALTLRFSGVNKATATYVISTEADGTMIDCNGTAQTYPEGGVGELGVSAFYLKKTAGETELMCKHRTSAGAFEAQPILRGVETFQVLLGYDSDNDGNMDSWLSPQNMPANSWMSVVAVKVGMVLRGEPGSSQSAAADAASNIYYPFGKDFIGGSSEAGLSFTPANPGDGRLRKAFSATFLLRNSLK